MIPAEESDTSAVRAEPHGRWFDIVRWTLFLLINAEELGMSTDNVARIRERARLPALRALLGTEGNAGASLGLEPNWAFNVLRQVGNYGDIFTRNLSPLGIKRGLNALWRDGGLLYAPPIR